MNKIIIIKIKTILINQNRAYQHKQVQKIQANIRKKLKYMKQTTYLIINIIVDNYQVNHFNKRITKITINKIIIKFDLLLM